MKKNIFAIFILISNFLIAQQYFNNKIEIMTLGVFHFNYPGLDVHKTIETDKIDVLMESMQKEMLLIAEQVSEFKPTHIAIEVHSSKQTKIDSVYKAYLCGDFDLTRDEIHQLGFRLGKMLGHTKLYCIDEQGLYYPYLLEIFNDSLKLSVFEDFYENNPDSLINKTYRDLYKKQDLLFKEEGLKACIRYLNNPELILLKQGAYLTGVFKYSSDENKYAGADFETCRWYNRNLRIFSNIQQITNNPEHRILLIIGAGHLGVLNPLFEASPEYELISPLNYINQ